MTSRGTDRSEHDADHLPDQRGQRQPAFRADHLEERQPDHRAERRPERQPEHQPDHRDERPGKDRAQLATMTVRELLAALGKVEEELRDTPFLLPREGIMVVNPRLAPLLSRQRTLAAQLRSRRVSWNRVDATAPRQPSAAWPPPPWA